MLHVYVSIKYAYSWWLHSAESTKLNLIILMFGTTNS